MIFLILLLVLISVAGWLAYVVFCTQLALRRWHAAQVESLHGYAEEIRDGHLQNLFALRRSLELLLGEEDVGNEKITEQIDLVSQQVHQLHQELEQLSDRLSPPFASDSLPFALKHVVERWQVKHPRLSVQLNIPEQWPFERPERHHILVQLLEAVFSQLLTETENQNTPSSFYQCSDRNQGNEPSKPIEHNECHEQKPVSVSITLKQESEDWASLVLQWSQERASPRWLPQLGKTAYILRTFEFMLPGRYSRKFQQGQEQWRLRWRLMETNFEDTQLHTQPFSAIP